MPWLDPVPARGATFTAAESAEETRRFVVRVCDAATALTTEVQPSPSIMTLPQLMRERIALRHIRAAASHLRNRTVDNITLTAPVLIAARTRETQVNAELQTRLR